jgi:hypothetical protein
MSNLWKAAVADNKEHSATKPTVEVVNAAVKGLLNMDQQAAHDVLNWASREGIEPDVVTYNILLREALRSAKEDSVPNLLRAMNKQGIQPDSATFTIILEEVLGGLHHASAAEQVEGVNLVFKDIEAAGLKPNLETYGKMLHAVASLANGGADEAIEAVQARMRASNLTITPHMVTILIERAVRREPPDVRAMESLLKEHKLSTISQGDQALWERVMTAYAETGHAVKAMETFDKLQEAGRPATSLWGLRSLLRTLMEEERREDAQRVVQTALEHKLKGRADGHGEDAHWNDRYWKHHFWYLAQEYGLLAGQKLPPELKPGARKEKGTDV